MRKKIVGTTERPRLSVFRSSKHVYAQIIDDIQGRTLAAASSLSKEVREQSPASDEKYAASKAVGSLLAKQARERGVTQVCFDRGPYLFHGKVKALAEACRQGGLVF